MQKLRKGDLVEIRAGAQRGKRGRVLEVLRDDGQVIVEGLNYRWKHLRRSQQNPQGGRVQREAPLPASRVSVVSEETDTAQRVHIVEASVARKDGRVRKVRYRVGAKDKQPISAKDKELAEKRAAGK